MTELTLKYFFEGDDTLPFNLADFAEPPTVLTNDRVARLHEWIGDVQAINGDIETGVTRDRAILLRNAHIYKLAFTSQGRCMLAKVVPSVTVRSCIRAPFSDKDVSLDTPQRSRTRYMAESKTSKRILRR